MLAFIKHLRKRWEDWCGDHEMETAIRKHLTHNGFFRGHGSIAERTPSGRTTPWLAAGFPI